MQEPGIRIRDALVRNACRNNPTVLAEWLVASHIEHAPHKNNKLAPLAPPQP